MKVSRLLRKTLFGVACLFALITTATGGVAAWNLYSSLIREYRSKGAAIARSIADTSVGILLNEDVSSVQATVDQYLNLEGVAYVFVVDRNGEVICHTFVPKVPDDLLRLAQAHVLPPGKDELAKADVTITDVGDFMDVAAPILGGLVGHVHVGMDRRLILNQIRDIVVRQTLLVLALFLLSVLVTYKIVQRVSQPLLQLTDYAEALSERDWHRPIDIRSNDEIGLLAHTMQDMAQDLAGVFGRLEEEVRQATAELRTKNERLERALERVKQMQHQVAVQEKLASLGTLTAGIAHEIKNPLNFVKNFSELSNELIGEIREDLAAVKDRLPPERAENIELAFADLEKNMASISQHGKRADSIVRNMLLHSRGQPGAREQTDINALVKEYVNLAFHSMRALHADCNVDFQQEYDPGLGHAAVVVQDVGRAFLNILTNACDAVCEKQARGDAGYVPAVSVRTRAVKFSLVGSADDSATLVDAAEIRIRDNGDGIPPDVEAKMFDPFFTTKPPGHGTGLGLSITNDIVVGQHRGKIDVKTAPGEFTEFVITLPLKSE